MQHADSPGQVCRDDITAHMSRSYQTKTIKGVGKVRDMSGISGVGGGYLE